MYMPPPPAEGDAFDLQCPSPARLSHRRRPSRMLAAAPSRWEEVVELLSQLELKFDALVIGCAALFYAYLAGHLQGSFGRLEAIYDKLRGRLKERLAPSTRIL